MWFTSFQMSWQESFMMSCLFGNTWIPHLHRFPPQNEEVLSPHHHEPHEFVAKDLLDLISLRSIRSAFRYENDWWFLNKKRRGEWHCVKWPAWQRCWLWRSWWTPRWEPSPCRYGWSPPAGEAAPYCSCNHSSNPQLHSLTKYLLVSTQDTCKQAEASPFPDKFKSPTRASTFSPLPILSYASHIKSKLVRQLQMYPQEV